MSTHALRITTTRLLTLVLFLGIFQFRVKAQSGPGGKGDTSGSSDLVLWLKADDGVLNSGASSAGNGDGVSTWLDRSGYGYDAVTAATSPLFNSSNPNLGGRPTITFAGGGTEFLFVEDDGNEAPQLDNTSEISIFYVFNPDNSSGVRAHLSKRDGFNSNQSYVFWENNNISSRIASTTDAGAGITGGNTYINALTFTGGTFDHFLNQVSGGGASVGGDVPSFDSDLHIGTFQSGDTRTFDGDIAEIIIFRSYMTNADRIVIESYLASKYDITLTYDFWDEVTYAAYDNEIAGIGQHIDGTIASASTSGVLTISGGDSRANGDWLFWGHDDGDFSSYTSTEIITGSSQLRLAREWVINETNEMGSVNISFDSDDLPATGLAAPDFYILVDSDGDSDFSDATAFIMNRTGTVYDVDIDLNEGDRIAVSFGVTPPAGLTVGPAFWFNSQAGVENSGVDASNGDNVTVWRDLSTNAANAQNGTSPEYVDTDPVNFYPVVRFDAASNEFLETDLSDLEESNYTLALVTRRRSSAGSQFLIGSENNTGSSMFLGYTTNTQLAARNSTSSSLTRGVDAFDSPIEGPGIQVLEYTGTSLELTEMRNSATNFNSRATTDDYAATGFTGNLGRAIGSNYFDGDIVEVVAFPTDLTATQFNALTSHLAIKYGVSTGGDLADEDGTLLWDLSDNTGYTSDVFGLINDQSFDLNLTISKTATDSLILSTNNDFTSLNTAGGRASLSDGQYLFVSNDNADFAIGATYNATDNNRLNRVWRVREGGGTGNVTVAIPQSIGSFNIMIVSSDPTFASGVTEVGLSEDGTYLFGSHDFTDGDYFTFTSDDTEIWYSYLSGNWSNPANWTLDGALSAGYVNPNGKVPTSGDSVVIQSGRTITADIDNIVVERIEIIGTLDLAGTSGHTFNSLEGLGTLRLSGNGGLDNYPNGTDSLFYDTDEGGTVEYYGSDIELNEIRRYNNLRFELNAGSDRATLTADSIYVNGDLTIDRGFFQFGDGVSTESTVVEVLGNTLVSATGGIDVGASNARHEFNLYGDFTNLGDVDFTNRTSQNASAEASDGIVDVNFVSPDQDQTVDLQNTTDFYRIEINKGVDDTYVLNLTADNSSFFNLYGYAGENINTDQETTNDNAFGLIYGTVRIGENININPINNTSNYAIYEGAALWVDGGRVDKTSGTAIVPYGNIRVSAGTLNATVSSGVTTRNNGQLTIEGGIVNVNQFRTSVEGVTAQGGLVMSGGIFNILGGSTNNDYYTFSLTYSGNVFNMSGGTINISDVNTKGAIYINSSDENINVTGGTVNFDVTNANDVVITSRAPFFNANLLNSDAGGTGSILIDAGSSGDGGGETSLTPDGLSILNDLRVDNSDGNGTTFDANGFDVNITGSFNIENGSVLDLTGMELSFDNNGSSSFNNESGITIEVDTLIVNKVSGLSTLDISNGPATSLQVNNLLNITNGNLDPATFNISLGGDLIVNDTIGTETSTGILMMEGAAGQAVSSTSGVVYDLEIDNANGVTLSGDLAIPGELALNDGIFDINTEALTLYSEVTTTGTFGVLTMIQTAGNTSDGGLVYYFDGTMADPAAVLYPIGTNANSDVRYTPASLDLSGIADDGLYSIRTSDTELQTVNTDVLANNLLTYYWTVENSGFATLPTVESLVLTADDSDDPDGGATPTGLPTDFVPGKVLNGSPFTRSQESVSDISGLVITFDGSGAGFTAENANYTAGDGTTTLFDLEPDVYYVMPNADRGAWNDHTHWTLNSDGSDDGDTGFPGVGDIAVLQNYGSNNDNHWITASLDVTIAELIFDASAGGWAPRFLINGNRTMDLGPVSGEGDIDISVSETNNTDFVGNTDLGEYVNNESSQFIIKLSSNNQLVDLPSTLPVYPNLRLEAGNNNASSTADESRILRTSIPIEIKQDLRMDRSTRFRVNHDMTVGDDVRITWNGNARTTLEIGDDREVTIAIAGDLRLQNGSNNSTAARLLVQNDDQQGFNHTISVDGNIELETGLGATSQFDLYNGTGLNNNATLILTGDSDASFTNESSATFTPDLYRLEMSKGADTTTTFTISNDIVLNGDNTTSPLPLVLTSGKLILDDADIDLELSNGATFTIPAGAGLEVANGTVTTENATMILDGLLRISGGTVDLNQTDIEYSNTGNAFLGISAGVLEVGGQVRRNTTTTSGILKYRQTGGDVDITTDKASVTTRAAFEVLNPGSEFTLTGGTFNIERGVTGDANESLELDPETYDLTGSTITIYENLGANYGSNFFNIQSSIPLNNVTVANTITLPIVRLYVQPLTINTLTINSNQRFRANNLDLTLTGDLINNGNYRNNSSNTTFRSDAAQSISGTGVFTLHDLTKEGVGITSSSVDLSLGNDLRVSEGTLNIGTNSISLKNDAYIESTLTNTSGNGLVFNGTSGQDLYGLANNLVSLGTITINNPTGVDIPDGNGYDFDITQELRLAGGVFNIGGSLITMKRGSTITEVSAFGVNNMVQTNSSFTDNGFVIEFFDVAADTTVFFPVGELKYTPVQFDIDAGATNGSIRVRPANERHPSIINDAEPATETEIDDTQNSLQYYWVVQAEDVTNVTGTATFFYDHEDILAVESDTANFIPARLLSDGATWDKFPPTFFKGGVQTFEVPLDIGAGVSASEITGDYTAGLGSTDGINNDIEGAIPDALAQYISNFGGAGNYSDDANWTPVGSSPALTSGIGPVGAQITIANGDIVTLDISNIRLFSTEIEEGGTIVVPSGVTNVRLGNVTGSGTIVLTNTELLPTGEYTDFLACDGGALQYDGNTNFSVLSGISQIRKVVLSGSGIRTMPNNVLNVCDTLLINGPTVAFNRGLEFTIGDEDTDRLELQDGVVTISNGTVVEINGDFVMSGGTLTGSNGTSLEITDDIDYTGGTIDFNNTDVLLIGSTEQLVTGDFTDGAAMDDLTINNSSAEGVTLSGGTLEIDGTITFTDGLLNTTSVRILNINSSGDWTGASTASYVTGPMRKENIAIASTYQFPVGKAVRYAPVWIANISSGGQTWTAEYFTSTGIYSESSFDDTDPGSGFNALSDVISQDRWEITSSGSNAAQIRLTYGTHHTIESLEDLRVVWWNTTDSEWKNQGGTVSGTMAGGTIISENQIGFSTQQFALGQAPEEPLPVEMLFFEASADDDRVVLEWATASELNNDRFEVERSFDGINFEKIGEVAGNGTISTRVDYSFADEVPGQGLNYYRLRQVDFDGAFEYSDIVFADYSNTSISFDAVAYPNPMFGQEVSVRLSTGDVLAPAALELIDLNGRVFYRESVAAEAMIDGYQLNVRDLAKGIYLLSVRQRNEVKQIRLLVR